MRVAVMLYAGFQLLEVTGVMDVFHEANRLSGRTFYEQHLVGASPGPVMCSNGTAVGTTEWLGSLRESFDIVVVPGSPVVGEPGEHRDLVRWLRGAGRRTQRLASVSNGAFLLARAGVADHHWLTTRSRDAERLASEYPLVHVTSRLGCLRDGNLYSAGGVNDGIHLALAFVREDLGEHVAARIGKTMAWMRPILADG